MDTQLEEPGHGSTTRRGSTSAPSGTPSGTPTGTRGDSPAEVRAPLVDPGRVGVAALFTLTTISSAGRGVQLLRRAAQEGLNLQLALELGLSVLTVVFCALVVLAYMRRGPARRTDRHLGAWIAAPLGTALPLLLPTLPQTIGSTTRTVVAFVVALTGTAFSIWAVRHLDTCLSIVPQARALVDTGPYALVRHPLYLGEIVTLTGFAIRSGHWSQGLLVLALLALQLYRAGREERLLTDVVPGYAEYRLRTHRIVPGLA